MLSAMPAGRTPPNPSGVRSLRALPKVELHRHLDGSVRISTIWEIAQERGIDLGARTFEELKQKAVLRRPRASLQSVLDCFSTQQAALCSFEAISRVTRENIEDAWRDGVRLLELRFAPAFIAKGKTISNDEIIGGVVDGMVKGMAAWPVQVGLIGILPRRYPAETHEQATDDLIRWKSSGTPGASRICGFDLADEEAGFDPHALSPFVERAREAGLGITVHSGENTDAACVARALQVYRPSRIGHGIRAIHDRALLRKLAEEDILLEVNPTSNWITSAVASLREHPLPALHRAGVPVCVNSDDPNLFGIDLVNEYEACVKEMGLSEDDLREMNLAALRHSFLPAEITGPLRDVFEQPR
jgi:adenosine deaminase